jgi:uncharacterized HAD superfamily protein
MENKKIKIAEDIDDVLLDFTPELNAFVNKKFGTTFRIEDYLYYDLEKVWGGTKQEAIAIVNSFYRSNEFAAVPPTFGAKAAVNILSQKYEQMALTSRPPFIREDTKKSLGKYFSDSISELFFNGQYGALSSNLDKSDYCLKNNAFVILEDNLDIAKKCAKKGIQAFLFNNFWNQGSLDSDLIIRVGEKQNPWIDILEHLM